MANESLVMTAEVRDNFSSTLRKLQNDLKAISSTGATSTKTMRQDWKGVSSEIQTASGSIVRDLLPALRLGNLAGLSLGGAIGGAAVALKGFAQSNVSLNNFSKEIGLSRLELMKLKTLGEFFGVDFMQTKSMARNFQNFMQALERDGGRTINHLRSTFGPAGDELAATLLKPGTFKQKMDLVFEAIRNVKSEATARKLAQELLGSEVWAEIIRNMTAGTRRALDEVRDIVDERTKEAAQKFDDNMKRLKVVSENLRNEALGPLLKATMDLYEKYNQPIGQSLRETFESLKITIPAVTQAFRDLMEGSSGILEFLDKIDKFTSSSTVGGLATRGLRALGIEPGSKPLSPAEALKKSMDHGGAAPGSPTKDIPKTNEELRQTNEKLKGATEKQTSAFERFIAALGLGGDTAGLGPGLGGVSAGGGTGALGAFRNAIAGGGGSGASIRKGAVTGGGGGAAVAGGNTQVAMRAAMDQLRKEGVPEGSLRAAAAHLVGQAQMESGLNPAAVHDQGTGAGIYGARDDPRPGGKQRRSRMFAWLAANGYDRNSLEGQQKYMAHEAMTDPAYDKTRRILMGANEKTLASDTHAITRNFEAPTVINNRSGAVLGAYRAMDPSAAPADLKDLRVKAGATGGGDADSGVVGLARYAQSNVEGFNRVTAMNDRFHQFRRSSKHNLGQALDFTVNDPRQAGAAAEKIRQHLLSSGIGPEDAKVLNEYEKKSAGATGGHLHVQFNTPDAAARYRKATLLQQQSKAEKAQESKLEANGTVNIHLNDGLRDKNARVNTDGMFKDVNVNRGKPMSTAEDNPIGRASAGF